MGDTPSHTNAADPVTRVLDLIASAAMFIAGTLMVLLIAIFGWLVFGRYVLNATPTWVEQAALLIVVWIAFLGAAVGIRRGTHLAVDFIREAFPGPIRKTLHFFALVALFGWGLVMCWQGFVMYERTASRVIPLLGLSEGWRAVPVIMGGAMIALFVADETVRRVMGKWSDAT